MDSSTQPKHVWEALCELVAREHPLRSVSNENSLCGNGAREVGRMLAAEREREETVQAAALGMVRFRSTATDDTGRLAEAVVRTFRAAVPSA